MPIWKHKDHGGPEASSPPGGREASLGSTDGGGHLLPDAITPEGQGEDPDTALGDHPTGPRDAGVSRLQRDPGRSTLEELSSGRVSMTSALTAGLWGQHSHLVLLQTPVLENPSRALGELEHSG